MTSPGGTSLENYSNVNSNDSNPTNQTVRYNNSTVDALYKLQFAFLIFGLLGNTMAFIVLCKHFRKTAYGILLAALAVSDISVLIVGGGRHSTKSVFGLKDIRLISAEYCIAQRFILYFALDLSAWLMATVAIERYITYAQPFKKLAGAFSVKRTVVVLLFVSVLVFSKNMHIFLTGSYTEGPRKTDCSYEAKHKEFMDKYFHVIVTVIYVVGPFSVMLIFNVLTVKALWKAFSFYRTSTMLVRKIQRKNLETQREQIRIIRDSLKNTKNNAIRKKQFVNTSNAVQDTPITSLQRRPLVGKYYNPKNNYDKREKKTMHMTLMCVIATVSFILLASPSFINVNVEKYAHSYDALRSAVVLLLLYVNHSINFVLYLASGKPFREHFLKMIGVNRIKKRDSALVTNTSLLINSATGTPRLSAENLRSPALRPTRSDSNILTSMETENTRL